MAEQTLPEASHLKSLTLRAVLEQRKPPALITYGQTKKMTLSKEQNTDGPEEALPCDSVWAHGPQLGYIPQKSYITTDCYILNSIQLFLNPPRSWLPLHLMPISLE